MKNFFLSLFVAMTVVAQIPGTIPVTSPIAPVATNSNYGVVDSRYVIGGHHDEFATTGQWQDREWLPINRMRVGMTVSARDNTNTFYVLRSIDPEIWMPVDRNPLGDGDHGQISAVNSYLGTGVTLSIDPGAVTYANIQALSTGQRLLGRGVGAGGAVTEISTGTGLTWAGNVLSATGGGGGSATNQTVIGVELLADMTNLAPAYLTGTAPVFVRTSGRTVAGVGGALYKYVPASVEAPNLGTIFAHSSLPGRLIYADVAPPNVDMFGAIPDFGGVNNGDDTAAFANAMSVLPVGGTLLLNLGTYRAVGIINYRAINLIGRKASRPTRYSINPGGISGLPAWGVGSEIEASGTGWIYSVGRPANNAHNPDATAQDEEYMNQPTYISGISFFGFKRTLDVGGVKLHNADNVRIYNCGFYCFQRAGLWLQKAVRESIVRDCEMRFCGNADAADIECPDPDRGWAALMLFDDSYEQTQIYDHNNFNLFENNVVSFSLGCAVIVDTKQPFGTYPLGSPQRDIVFNERFRNNIWHGYSDSGSSTFASEFAASANKYTSPLMVLRCSTRLDIKGDLFWFTGMQAHHISFENNNTATNYHSFSPGSTYANIEGCSFGFYYNASYGTTGMIHVNSDSSAHIGQNFFYGNNGGNTSAPRVVNSGTVLDDWMSGGRTVVQEFRSTGKSTFGTYLELPQYTTTGMNALTAAATGSLIYNTTEAQLAVKTALGWKFVTLDP